MPEKIIQTWWKCLICGEEYQDKDKAAECEGTPVTDYKFEISDKVRDTSTGDSGVVTERYRAAGKNTHQNMYKIKLRGDWFRDVFEEDLQKV